MNRIAKFEKVSFQEFHNSYDGIDCKEVYEGIILPKRATVGSAGYDFYAPYDFNLSPGQSIKIPTGIRCQMKSDYVLLIFPRSSLGFKYSLALNNTIGVIDSDYYEAINEGHIFVKLTNNNKEDKTIMFKKGVAFVQGVFLNYGITVDDESTEIREGGFGSTDKKGQ